MSHNNSPPLSALMDGSASSTRTGRHLSSGLAVLWCLKPARKRKGVLSTSWDSALHECQPGFYRCGGTTTARVPTGLLPVW
jgi:hypothetical protein